MKITVYSIEKSQSLHVKSLIDEYIKMSSKFATVKDEIIYTKQIAKAQTQDINIAKMSYTKAFLPYLGDFNVCLHVNAQQNDSYEFAQIFKNKQKINFFIGGAFGFDDEFLSKSQKIISLSRLTYAHKIAKVVLYEQIYRSLSILNKHPYHK